MGVSPRGVAARLSRNLAGSQIGVNSQGAKPCKFVTSLRFAHPAPGPKDGPACHNGAEAFPKFLTHCHSGSRLSSDQASVYGEVGEESRKAFTKGSLQQLLRRRLEPACWLLTVECNQSLP